MYDRYEDPYNQRNQHKKNGRNVGLAAFAALTAVIFLVVIIVLLVSVFSGNDTDSSSASRSDSSASDALGATQTVHNSVIITTATPSPSPTMAAYQNSVLYPASAKMNVPIGTPGTGLSAAERKVVQSVLSGDSDLSPFARSVPVSFGDALDYQSVPGILTFRGNNFRNCASWGTAVASASALEQIWEYSGIGGLTATTGSFSWTGTGWTGQPLVIEWDWDVQQMMNMYPEKKVKKGLTEVIVAAMDGKIYFFDLDDGTMTRDPINVGFTIKGTPCLDPRGYPILYVGQGDNNGADGKIGFRIYSLIDDSLLYYQDGMDSRANRTDWGACDSSPIVNASSDTLIFPSENGLVYTLKLNTSFNRATGALSISPESIAYKYLFDGVSGNATGIESSMAVYSHYGYFCDNTGNLICMDLNTMQMIWAVQLGDNSDVTPVIEEEDGRVYLYTGTQVNWQRTDEPEYTGAAYTYKFDAMTGEEVWQTSQPCHTRNGESADDSVNGGMYGTPVCGRKSISDLVIYSYCMTTGINSGNMLVAYDKTTGEEVWRYAMNMYSWSSPVDCYDADGNAYIIICDSIGQIHLVNGLTGTRINFLQTIRGKGTADETKTGLNMESSPIVYNGMIVIGTRAGSVFGVKIK